VRYDFETQRGEGFSEIASDGKGNLAIGMEVPVFYDPRNPKKHVALCNSFFEVVLPIAPMQPRRAKS
jgi:hypothetical protein